MKVVKKPKLRKLDTKYGPATIQPVVVKDINGKKNILSIWPSHKDPHSITEGKVYVVNNIKIDNYPDEKPFQIVSRKYFKMEIAPQDVQEKFNDITNIDGKINGVLWGVLKLKAYQSCPNCFSALKADDAKVCDVCEAVVESKRDDFNCILVIESKETGNEFEILTFKKLFDFNLENSSNNELEIELNQKLFGQEAEIEFTTKRAKNGVVSTIAQSLKLFA